MVKAVGETGAKARASVCVDWWLLGLRRMGVQRRLAASSDLLLIKSYVGGNYFNSLAGPCGLSGNLYCLLVETLAGTIFGFVLKIG